MYRRWNHVDCLSVPTKYTGYLQELAPIPCMYKQCVLHNNTVCGMLVKICTD